MNFLLTYQREGLRQTRSSWKSQIFYVHIKGDFS